MTPHSGYRGPSHHSMAGDSGYFHSGSRSAKSYSDTDFGLRHTTASSHMPYSMTPQTYQMSHAMHVSFIFSRHLSCLANVKHRESMTLSLLMATWQQKLSSF